MTILWKDIKLKHLKQKHSNLSVLLQRARHLSYQTEVFLLSSDVGYTYNCMKD